MILQTLYQQGIKHGVQFFDEYHFVDLLFGVDEANEGGRAAGVIAYGSQTARCTRSRAKSRAHCDRGLRADVPDHVERDGR